MSYLSKWFLMSAMALASLPAMTATAEASHHHPHHRVYPIYWRYSPRDAWVLYTRSYRCPIEARNVASWLESNYGVQTSIRTQ